MHWIKVTKYYVFDVLINMTTSNLESHLNNLFLLEVIIRSLLFLLLLEVYLFILFIHLPFRYLLKQNNPNIDSKSFKAYWISPTFPKYTQRPWADQMHQRDAKRDLRFMTACLTFWDGIACLFWLDLKGTWTGSNRPSWNWDGWRGIFVIFIQINTGFEETLTANNMLI